jgi:hypothetical protein
MASDECRDLASSSVIQGLGIPAVSERICAWVERLEISGMDCQRVKIEVTGHEASVSAYPCDRLMPWAS